MDSLEAAIQSTHDPDELYGKAFLCFQALFRTTNRDVSRIQLPSYLPATLYNDPPALNAVMTAALLAMLDCREKTGGQSLALAEVPLYINVIMQEAVPKSVEHMDSIILEQVSIIGVGLLASDLVKSRVHYWERHDYETFKRWLRALDKAARIHQQKTSPPLDDPFQRDVKQQAVKELAPVVARVRAECESMNAIPTEQQIVDAFEREAMQDVSWLTDRHTLGLWLQFLRTDPLSVLNCSAPELFDDFAAFVTMHNPEYIRQKFSSRS